MLCYIVQSVAGHPLFITGVQRNEELPIFISSLFEGVGQLLPGNLTGLLMSRPGSSQLGTLVAKRCRRGFLEIYRVLGVDRGTQVM